MDKKSGGFTLIELIVVIAILGILAAVPVPRITRFKSIAEESVCEASGETIERMYAAFLVENDINHEDSIFNQFLIDNFNELCPSRGVITYEGGKVRCGGHGDEEEPPGEDSPGEEVLWL